jgi:hypothetical protein
MSFAQLAGRASRLVVNNSPTILTSIGVVGTITTAWLAGKASFNAADLIRLQEASEYGYEEDRREPREVIGDRIKLVWRLYIPAITTGAATIACIISADRVGHRRYVAMAAATTIVEKSFDEYKDKIVEKFGPKKEEMVRAEVAQDRLARIDDTGMIDVEVGQLCFDSFSARYFKSTVEQINAAVNTVNNLINHDGVATLGDFYREVEIEPTAYSELVGWNVDRLIEVTLSSALTRDETRSVIVVDFRPLPEPDYGRGRFH